MEAIACIAASGKAAGILSTVDEMTQNTIAAGARFVAVGLDVSMLLRTAKATAHKWRDSVG